MQYKVSELVGPLLDVAVAMEEGYKWRIGKWDYGARDVCYAIGQPGDSDIYSPSECWADGGPIIQREGISVMYDDLASDDFCAWIGVPKDIDGVDAEGVRGETPLIAAMRAYVASKYGDVVDLP